ncbi:hypothetical protein DPMN_171489 [Dreissena polymorpha]|uniref:Uncharacterized protein n=1 Tax=Dreissena polymorpha TaxID=45954 RepID=A0A9D4E177_DREPO|nr:hypothetical protein DPMN_171489 [Dreissena polymorpha]
MRSQTYLPKDACKRSITEKKACNKKTKGLYSITKRIAADNEVQKKRWIEPFQEQDLTANNSNGLHLDQ